MGDDMRRDQLDHHSRRHIGDEPLTNIVSMNFSGRFTGQEVKDLGVAVIRNIVTAKHVRIVIGQQVNFRLTSLPPEFELVGGKRAFLMYDRKQFLANDEIQYRHFLRDLELRGRLPKYYLPEANYALCKMKSKRSPETSFLAMSWMSDESKDDLKSINLLRKLLNFAANLCAIEEMPIIIGGSFRLSLDDAKQVVYNEFEGFRCYGYKTDKPRRAVRMCDLFISCPPLKLDDVKPLVYTKIEIHSGSKSVDRWRNPEDAFYWDPVVATLLRRTTDSTSSGPSVVTSPRALSPMTFEMPEVGADAETHDDDVYLGGPPPIVQPFSHAFETEAEETLKALLIESDRIKEMVGDVDSWSHSSRHEDDAHISDDIQERSNFSFTSFRPVQNEGDFSSSPNSESPSSQNTAYEVTSKYNFDDDVQDPATSPEVVRFEASVFRRIPSSGLRREENGDQTSSSTSTDSRSFKPFSLKDDKIQISNDLDNLTLSGQEKEEPDESVVKFTNGNDETDRSNPQSLKGPLRDAAKKTRSMRLPGSEGAPVGSSLEVAHCGGSPLRKTPSYLELYDEELIDSNFLCYMQ